MKRVIICSLLVFSLWLSQLGLAQVQASDATGSSPMINDSKVDLEQQRQSLRDTYRAEIQAYQASYRKFALAKAQFQKLETLASLEEAVASTREVFIARNAVLLTYLDQLNFELQFNPSYDDEIKQTTLNKIADIKNNLLTYDQLVINSQDRQALAERATGFIPIGDEIRQLSDQTRKLVFLGKFRASAGLAQQLTQEVKDLQAQNPVSALKQGERQRAYQELASADTVVQTAWQKSVLAYQNRRDYSNETYTTFIATLTPLQSALIRWFTLLEQTMKL